MSNKFISYKHFTENTEFSDQDDECLDIIRECWKNNNCDEIQNILEIVDSNNLPHSTNTLSIMYRNGIGVSKDDKLAVYWSEKSFRRYAILESGISLSALYYKMKEYQKGFELLTELIPSKHDKVFNDLGYYYKKGLYVDKDLAKAESYYLKALEYGSLTANNDIAYLNLRKGNIIMFIKYFFGFKYFIAKVRDIKNNPYSQFRK